MRLLKLLAYGLLGYAIYEFFRGMSSDIRGSGGGQLPQPRRELRALNSDQGRMAMTGQGRGTTVSTEDSDGGSANRVVGRGAVPQ